MWYRVTVTLSQTYEAQDSQDALVRFLQSIDLGAFDTQLTEAHVQEVDEHGNPH